MAIYNPKHKLAQIGLIAAGFLKEGQDDGYWGDITDASYHHWLLAEASGQPPVGTNFPPEVEAQLNSFYGIPDWGDETPPNQVRVHLPYPMKLSWSDQTITSTRCNIKVKASLELILAEILEVFGIEGIRKNGLDIFGGLANVRRSTRSLRPSTHSWGIAVDINPKSNGLYTRRPNATMPLKVAEIFERHGWMSGGRAWGDDWMHFQATARPAKYPKYS